MTEKDLDWICRHIDSLIITAVDVPQMYRKLNVLENNGGGGWRMMRAPQWRGDKLIAVVIRRSHDYPELFHANTPADLQTNQAPNHPPA